MRNRFYIALVLIILFNPFCIGQNSKFENPRVKKLKTTNKFSNNEVSIITNVVDSTKNINIFLVNKTKDSLHIFGGFSPGISFNKEIKDNQGNWQPFDQLDRLAYWCITGHSSIELLENFYTYEIYSHWKYSGDFETEMRFSYRLKDSLIIYSKPINLSVNRDLLLTHSERFIKICNNELTDTSLNYNQKEKLIQKIIKVHNKYLEPKKSIIVCENWLENYPNAINIRYQLANSFIKYFSQHRKELTKVEINLLLSKAINELSTIPKTEDPISIQAADYITTFSKYLLSKSEWDKLEKQDCIIENETTHCYYRALTVKKIRVLFKD